MKEKEGEREIESERERRRQTCFAIIKTSTESFSAGAA
jgi:hypothetical protein